MYGTDQEVIEFVGPAIGLLFKAAGGVVMSRKSRKAIRERASSIREKAETLPESEQDEASKKYARLALAVVDKAMTQGGSDLASSSTCHWCFKSLSSAEKKQCAGCKRAIYCSRECQVHDWKEGGHKQDCKLMATSYMQAAATEASKREVKNAKRLEQNVSAAGAELFDERLGDIMRQATEKGRDVLDCVIVLDLRDTPPTFDTPLASEFIDESKQGNSHEDNDHLVRMVERNRRDRSLTVACKAPPIGGAFVPDEANCGVMLMKYPVEPGEPTWNELQQYFSR